MCCDSSVNVRASSDCYCIRTPVSVFVDALKQSLIESWRVKLQFVEEFATKYCNIQSSSDVGLSVFEDVALRAVLAAAYHCTNIASLSKGEGEL